MLSYCRNPSIALGSLGEARVPLSCVTVLHDVCNIPFAILHCMCTGVRNGDEDFLGKDLPPFGYFSRTLSLPESSGFPLAPP